jgi:DNA-directed RNA polymerase subunit RPC12/RpoP
MKITLTKKIALGCLLGIVSTQAMTPVEPGHVLKPIAIAASSLPTAGTGASDAPSSTETPKVRKPFCTSPHSAFTLLGAAASSESPAFAAHEGAGSSSSSYGPTPATPLRTSPHSAFTLLGNAASAASAFTVHESAGSSSSSYGPTLATPLRTRINRLALTASALHRIDLNAKIPVARRRYDRSATETNRAIVTLICPYRCDDETFESMHLLAKHVKEHHLAHKNTFICDRHGRTFPQISDFILHLYSDIGYKAYRCSKCGKTFARPGGVNHHLASVEDRQAPYVCHCGHVCSQRCDWAEHILRCPQLDYFLTKEHTYQCPCGFVGSAESISDHTDECSWAPSGALVCPCKKVFSLRQIQSWRTHQEICPDALAQRTET